MLRIIVDGLRESGIDECVGFQEPKARQNLWYLLSLLSLQIGTLGKPKLIIHEHYY